MPTTDLITPADASHDAEPSTDPRAEAPPSGLERPRCAETLQAILPVVGVVAVAGPPVVLLAGPVVLFALMVAGPFVLLLTVVAVLVGSMLVVALVGAILASPYLLVRHVRERRAAARSSSSASAPRLVRAGGDRQPAEVARYAGTPA
jgi:uncharacterized membrane-anchored protein